MCQKEQENQLLNFAHNVIVLRRQKGLSKTAMARLLHTSVRTINRLENGEFPRGLGVEILFHAHEHFSILPHLLLEKRL